MDNIIFIHIPKTGGSTFHTILNKKYKKSEVYNLFGSKMSSKEIVDFSGAPEKKRGRVKLLKGHMPFGLHSYLPEGGKYISFLRNPVDRVISQYYYIKKNKYNPNHEAVHNGGMSIRDFVESGIVIGMNNGQSRFLTGDVDRLEYGNSKGLFEEVKRNINEQFIWIGITERFDESVLTLSNILGWTSPPYYIKQNISVTRKSIAEVPESDIKVIEKYNEIDIALYEYANQILNEEVERVKNFGLILSRYREVNERLSNRWQWLPEKLQSYII